LDFSIAAWIITLAAAVIVHTMETLKAVNTNYLHYYSTTSWDLVCPFYKFLLSSLHALMLLRSSAAIEESSLQNSLADSENNRVCSCFLELIKEDEFSFINYLIFNSFIYEIGGRLLFEEDDYWGKAVDGLSTFAEELFLRLFLIMSMYF